MDDWIRAATEGNMPPTQVVDMYWKDHYGTKNPYRSKDKTRLKSASSPKRQHFNGVNDKKINFNNADYQRLLVKSRNITAVRNKTKELYGSSIGRNRNVSRWPENQMSPRSPRGGGWSTSTKLRDDYRRDKPSTSPRGRPISPRGRPASPRSKFNKPKQSPNPNRSVRPGTGVYKHSPRNLTNHCKRPTRDPYSTNLASRPPTKVQYLRTPNTMKKSIPYPSSQNNHKNMMNPYRANGAKLTGEDVVTYEEHTVVSNNYNLSDVAGSDCTEYDADGIDVNKVKQMEKRVYELYGIPTWVVGGNAPNNTGAEDFISNEAEEGDDIPLSRANEFQALSKQSKCEVQQPSAVEAGKGSSLLGSVISNAKQWLSGGNRIHPGANDVEVAAADNVPMESQKECPYKASQSPSQNRDPNPSREYDHSIIYGSDGERRTYDKAEQMDVWKSYKQIELDRMLIDSERVPLNKPRLRYTYSPFEYKSTNGTNTQSYGKTEMNYHDEHKHVLSNRNSSYEHLNIPLELLGGPMVMPSNKGSNSSNMKRPVSASGYQLKKKSNINIKTDQNLNPYLVNRPRPASANSANKAVVSLTKIESEMNNQKKGEEIRTNRPFSSGDDAISDKNTNISEGNPVGPEKELKHQEEGVKKDITTNSKDDKKEPLVIIEDSLDKEVVKPKHPLLGGGMGKHPMFGGGGGANFLDALKNSKNALKKVEKEEEPAKDVPLTKEQLLIQQERIEQYKALEMAINRLYLPIIPYSEFEGADNEPSDADLRHSLLGRGKFAAVYKAKCKFPNSVNKLLSVQSKRLNEGEEFVCALKMSQYRYRAGIGHPPSGDSSPHGKYPENSFAASSAKFSSNLVGQLEPPVAISIEYEREIKAMMILKGHANILQLYGVITPNPDMDGIHGNTLGLVLEYMSCGNVGDVLESSDWQSNHGIVDRLRIVKDVACGIAHMHKYNILHRDLKIHNIMLHQVNQPDGTKLIAKIGDFGTSVTLEEGEMRNDPIGTLGYLAPEMYNPGQYSFPADIFAFAVIAWYVFSQNRDNPMASLSVADGNSSGPKTKESSVKPASSKNALDVDSDEEVVLHAANEEATSTIAYQLAEKGVRPKFGPEHPAFISELIEGCWMSFPKLRPTAAALALILHDISTDPSAAIKVYDRKYAHYLNLNKSMVWDDFDPSHYILPKDSAVESMMNTSAAELLVESTTGDDGAIIHKTPGVGKSPSKNNSKARKFSISSDGKVQSMAQEVPFLGSGNAAMDEKNQEHKEDFEDSASIDAMLQVQPRSLLTMMSNVGVHLMTSVKSLKNKQFSNSFTNNGGDSFLAKPITLKSNSVAPVTSPSQDDEYEDDDYEDDDFVDASPQKEKQANESGQSSNTLNIDTKSPITPNEGIFSKIKRTLSPRSSQK